MRTLALTLVLATPLLAQAPHYRTLNDRFTPPAPASREEWTARVPLRARARAGLGRAAADAGTHPAEPGRLRRDPSRRLPGLESLFREPARLLRHRQPLSSGRRHGPFPAVLSPHGHWTYGRLENTPSSRSPAGPSTWRARVSSSSRYDMIGYNDSRQLTAHVRRAAREPVGPEPGRPAAVEQHPRARLSRIAALRAARRLSAPPASRAAERRPSCSRAVDERVAVAAPVNMISLHMQGGCLCENLPGLRLDTNNVEIAATIAPRPLLMVSATGDWTNETLEVEYPGDARDLRLFRAPAIAFAPCGSNAEHNYNKDSREAMYAWMARWLQHAPADGDAAREGRSRPTRSPICSSSTAGRCRTPPSRRRTLTAQLDRRGEGAARDGRRRRSSRRRCATRSATARRPRARRSRARVEAPFSRCSRRHSPTLEAALRRAGFDGARASPLRRSTRPRRRRSAISRPTTAPPRVSASPTSSTALRRAPSACSWRMATRRSRA